MESALLAPGTVSVSETLRRLRQGQTENPSVLVSSGLGEEGVERMTQTPGQELVNTHRGDVREAGKPQDLCRGGRGPYCCLWALNMTCSP